MRRPNRFFAALATSAILTTAPMAATAADDSDFMERAEPFFAVWRGGVDLFVLRPLSATRLVVGTFVAMPVSTVVNAIAFPLGRDTSVFKDDYDKFMVEPWQYSFERELGEDLAGI